MLKPERWNGYSAILALAGAVAVGAFLRLLRLGEQVLGGDELHGVRAALARPVGEILVTYQAADPCLPLAALYRFLMDLGVRPSEWTLRLPVLLFALATPLWLPLLAWRAGWLERRGALLFAGLLAVSPLLVLYGRIARPYGMVVPLVFTALVAFDGYRAASAGRGRLRARAVNGATFAVTAALALYLNLATAPILGAPFVFAVGENLWRRGFRKGHATGMGRPWRSLAGLAAVTALLVAAFLIPAWPSFRTLMEAKGGEGSVQGESLVTALLLHAGTARPWVAAVFWGLAAAGCGLLIRRRRRLGLYLLSAVVIHAVGLLVLSPFGIESPAVLTRYLLVALPIVLLWVAFALAALVDHAHRRPRWVPAMAFRTLPVIVLAGLFLASPLAQISWWDSSFLHHADTLRFDRPLPRVMAEALPSVYRTLPELPSGAIVEAPVRTPWRFARAVYAYQRQHRRRVLLVSDDPQLCDPRLALQNHVCPGREDCRASLRAAGVVALLVHLDAPAEEARVQGPPAALDRRARQTRQRLGAQGQRLRQWMTAEFGLPTSASSPEKPRVMLWTIDSPP